MDDACTYIDALRLLDRTQQAEVVARHYAFRSPHSRNQRFLNTLYALSNQPHYYNKGEADYAVRLLAGSTAAEYWLGEWDGRIFCAASQSRMLDPRKVFFHRTEYFSIGGDGELKPLRDLPREVQNGAAASEGDLRVVTGINYRGSDRIHGVDVKELFRTQLFYTVYNARRGGWSALQPLFEHQEEACYAHPVLLDGGRMLLFASDLEGGYGGMDLYVSYWNEQTERWSRPRKPRLDGQHRRRRDIPLDHRRRTLLRQQRAGRLRRIRHLPRELRRGQDHVQLAVASSLPDQLRV